MCHRFHCYVQSPNVSWIFSLEVYTSEEVSYPDEFNSGRKDRKYVRKVIRKNFPGLPQDLPTLGDSLFHTLLVEVPPEILLKNPLHPPYYLARFEKVLSHNIQADILAAWGNLLHPSRQPKCRINHGGERSGTPAYHLGIWEMFNSKPTISLEAREQTPEVIKAIDYFLSFFHRTVAGKINRLLKRYAPHQYEQQQR